MRLQQPEFIARHVDKDSPGLRACWNADLHLINFPLGNHGVVGKVRSHQGAETAGRRARGCGHDTGRHRCAAAGWSVPEPGRGGEEARSSGPLEFKTHRGDLGNNPGFEKHATLRRWGRCYTESRAEEARSDICPLLPAYVRGALRWNLRLEGRRQRRPNGRGQRPPDGYMRGYWCHSKEEALLVEPHPGTCQIDHRNG